MINVTRLPDVERKSLCVWALGVSQSLRPIVFLDFFLVGKSIALPDPAPGRLRTPPSSVVSIGLSRFKATPLAALFAVFDCRDSNVFVFGARQYRLLLSRFPIMCPCDRTWTGRITPRGQAAWRGRPASRSCWSCPTGDPQVNRRLGIDFSMSTCCRSYYSKVFWFLRIGFLVGLFVYGKIMVIVWGSCENIDTYNVVVNCTC